MRASVKLAAIATLAALATLGGCSGSGAVCAECMEEKCNDLVAVCETDPDCACMVECTGENGIPGIDACLGTCGLDQRPVAFGQVEECTAVACPDTGDECSTPDDWTPPDDTIPCDGTGTGGIGGGSLADCSFDSGLTFDPDGAVLQLESADQDLCARIERRDEGSGSLANTSWTLLSMRIGPPGEVALVDAAADLCWYSSHHNFRDWAHAWTGTRHFDLVLREDGHSGARTYEAYVFEEGPLEGACAATTDGVKCIDGPIELFPVSP